MELSVLSFNFLLSFFAVVDWRLLSRPLNWTAVLYSKVDFGIFSRCPCFYATHCVFVPNNSSETLIKNSRVWHALLFKFQPPGGDSWIQFFKRNGLLARNVCNKQNNLIFHYFKKNRWIFLLELIKVQVVNWMFHVSAARGATGVTRNGVAALAECVRLLVFPFPRQRVEVAAARWHCRSVVLWTGTRGRFEPDDSYSFSNIHVVSCTFFWGLFFADA